MNQRSLVLALVVSLVAAASWADEPALRVATFEVDVTPPLGSPVAYAPARSIDDPLSARGLVLVPRDQQPIVLCAVDWIGIGNGGHDAWRDALAKAVGTTRQRVAVHSLHQHDAPRCDFDAEQHMAAVGLGGTRFDVGFTRQVLEKLATAARSARQNLQPVTHVGTGSGTVEKVASNRRVLGDDGRVKIVRYSASRKPEAIAAPEGVIDPLVRLVSFWNGDRPLASVTWYATHPQSYYGKGDVTCEFVGLARNRRQAEQPELLHIHFNGAGGNVAAGKYNDGSPEMRPILAERLWQGLHAAWQSQTKTPLSAEAIEWRVAPVKLPPAEHVDEGRLRNTLQNEQASSAERLNAATRLSFLARMQGDHQIDIACLRLGDVYLLHLPGELFVEYQLMAQQMRPDAFVCLAAYGDYGPGYIGTEIAYTQGGYETSARASATAPQVEHVLTDAMRRLLAR